jgi:putative methionine-R-sulfoxide reductase with GAF domain
MTAQPSTTHNRIGLFSVRNRLVFVMLLAVIVPVVVTTYFGVTTTQRELEKELDQKLYAFALEEADALSIALANQVSVLALIADNEALEDVVEAQTQSYTGAEDEALATILEQDETWRAADANNDNREPLVANVLLDPASRDLVKVQREFPAHVELFATDSLGAVVLATTRTSDYYQADEDWWQVAWNDGEGAVYIDDEVSYDASADAYSINIAVPIIEDEIVVGVLRSTFDIGSLRAGLASTEIGDTGHATLLNNQATVLLSRQEIDLTNPPTLDDVAPLLGQTYNPDDGELVHVRDETGEQDLAAYAPVTTNGALPAIDNLGWFVAIFQTEEEAFQPVDNALNAAVLSGAAVAIIGAVLAYGFSLTITRPLQKLTATAQRLSATEDWSLRADVTSADEFGVLGQALNDMTAHLQELIASLEQRIAARTRDLQLAAQVSEEVATILDLDQLLPHVVELTKDNFRLYHAHIYLLDEDRENLVLAAGAGEAGRIMKQRGHSIPIDADHSIVAHAARSNEPIITDDVTDSPDFLANPLLPDTRSEAAFPLVVGDRVLGVLDVQSEQTARFDADFLVVLSTLAGQIAVALDNARLFSEVDRASRHEQALSAVTHAIQGATSIEEVLQAAARELGRALRVPHTAIEMQLQEAVEETEPPDASPDPDRETELADAATD